MCLMNKKGYKVDEIISASDIWSGNRYPLLKSGSLPTYRTWTIWFLMTIFLHQQESTIRHILEDIKNLSEEWSVREKSYKIGSYKEEIIFPDQLERFDKEVYDYFASLTGYTVELNLAKSYTAWGPYPVWIKISR